MADTCRIYITLIQRAVTRNQRPAVLTRIFTSVSPIIQKSLYRRMIFLLLLQSVVLKKILLGYDGTAQAQNALEFGISLAVQDETKLHLAFIVHEPTGMADPVPDEVYRSLEGAGQRILSDAVQEAKNQMLEPIIHLESGNPPEKLFQLAQEIQPDLVILGMTKHPTSEKMLGTMSSYFLKSKKYPLLLVP
jgi:nucleotide-binding universal stress UspA family protein